MSFDGRYCLFEFPKPKKKVVLYGDRELVIEMYRLYTFKTHQAIYI